MHVGGGVGRGVEVSDGRARTSLRMHHSNLQGMRITLRRGADHTEKGYGSH